jgi:phosphatidylserine decarboxylase
MLEDIKRTFGEVFGWVKTILPIGRRASIIIISLSLILLWSYFYYSFFPLLILFIAYLLLGAFVAFFFRDPLRNTVYNANEIAAPADGRVLSIKTEDDPNVLVIRIFLSIFNVHIQRATIAGKVEDTVYTKGTFAFANNPSADKNERNLIKIKNGEKFAHVEQITGAIARRIECWVKKGEEVKAGQKVGLIHFGSQVAVYLPKDKVIITVKEGQMVQGALSVLGLWKD